MENIRRVFWVKLYYFGLLKLIITKRQDVSVLLKTKQKR